MLLEKMKERLAHMEQSVENSAVRYVNAENQLKQMLADHNAIVGAKSEIENSIAMIEEEAARLAAEEAARLAAEEANRLAAEEYN